MSDVVLAFACLLTELCGMQEGIATVRQLIPVPVVERFTVSRA